MVVLEFVRVTCVLSICELHANSDLLQTQRPLGWSRKCCNESNRNVNERPSTFPIQTYPLFWHCPPDTARMRTPSRSIAHREYNSSTVMDTVVQKFYWNSHLRNGKFFGCMVGNTATGLSSQTSASLALHLLRYSANFGFGTNPQLQVQVENFTFKHDQRWTKRGMLHWIILRFWWG